MPTVYDPIANSGCLDFNGADPNQFNAIEQSLSSTLRLTVLDGTNSNYVTSAQSRTIWAELNLAADFNALFGTTLYQYTDPHHQGNDFVFWNGNLSLPEGSNVQGLCVGNGSSLQPALAAQDIAALHNFPL